MKKRFSIKSLLVAIALIAAACAWLVSLRSNRLLHSEIDSLRETVNRTEEMADGQRRLLAEARLGSTLLCRMALSKDYDDLFEFIRTIPAESLGCRTMDLPEYPSVQLITFHHQRFGEDGSTLPIDECKSATILVRKESLEVVDYDLHKGVGSIDESSVPPFYVLCKDLPDGTSVKYTVLPTGFETQN